MITKYTLYSHTLKINNTVQQFKYYNNYRDIGDMPFDDGYNDNDDHTGGRTMNTSLKHPFKNTCNYILAVMFTSF